MGLAVSHCQRRAWCDLLLHCIIETNFRVPESDLSFPPQSQSVPEKVKAAFRSVCDVLFGGKFGIGQPQIQITLQTSQDSFADIRRKRQEYYGEELFPSQEEWKTNLTALDISALSNAKTPIL